MSVKNHLSSELPERFWWSSKQQQQQQQQQKGVNFDLNDGDEPPEEQISDERDQETLPKLHLFEKPLTPSDVGKLNRLVIPKQHAEKYFPLTGQDNAAAATGGEKGLLLSFEDESGKLWRFRYSYWNSSQSYVLTKGWSRFVKEKRLDAGDVVLFQRHLQDNDRLFIGWRRRSGGGAAVDTAVSEGRVVGQPGTVVGGGWGQVYYPYPPASLPYQPDYLHAGASMTQSQTPSSGSSRTLRLFGVNLECQPTADETEPATPEGSTTSSSQGQTGHHYLYQYYSNPLSSYNNHYTHTQDLNFTRDVNQMRYQQG